MIAGDRKPAGINRRLTALRASFAWAVADSLATTSLAVTVWGLGQVCRLPKALSAQEAYRSQRTAAAQRQLVVAEADGAVTPTKLLPGAMIVQPGYPEPNH